jgi:hypothetical protein
MKSFYIISSSSSPPPIIFSKKVKANYARITIDTKGKSRGIFTK